MNSPRSPPTMTHVARMGIHSARLRKNHAAQTRSRTSALRIHNHMRYLLSNHLRDRVGDAVRRRSDDETEHDHDHHSEREKSERDREKRELATNRAPAAVLALGVRREHLAAAFREGDEVP